MIGILSDTHDNAKAASAAADIFRQANVTRVIHCGDIVSPEMLEIFTGLPATFIFGNNEYQRRELRAKASKLGFGDIEDELLFEDEQKKFYVYHGTDARVLRRAIELQTYDYVLTGHTHEVRDDTVGRTRVINPGALFRAQSYTVALLEPQSGVLKIVPVAK